VIDATQNWLIPPERPTMSLTHMAVRDLDHIDLSMVKKDRLYEGRKASIAEQNMIVPIVVSTDDPPRLEDGRKRLLIARELGMKLIPVRIIEAGTYNRDTIGLITHHLAGDPLVADLEALAAIRDRYPGMDMRDAISRDLHLNYNDVDKGLAITELPAEIVQAVIDGAVAPGVAQKIARQINPSNWPSFVQILLANGTIKHKDVDGVLTPVVTSQTVVPPINQGELINLLRAIQNRWKKQETLSRSQDSDIYQRVMALVL
jgi:ParB-like chromosome segregation protein Spo0J